MSATKFIQASEAKIGDKVLVSDRFAFYHGKAEAEGAFLPIVGINVYDHGNGNVVIGITLEGFPETCSRDRAPLEVEA